MAMRKSVCGARPGSLGMAQSAQDGPTPTVTKYESEKELFSRSSRRFNSTYKADKWLETLSG